ncbi:MAG: hypothetical protein ACKVOK_03655 [Flavobacteriales bacterium]
MKLSAVLIVFSLLINSHVHSQDTLLLMNGQEMLCKILHDTSTVIVMEVTKKNGKVKVREVHKSDVFSVTKKDSSEVVLYTQNEMFGDIFTEQEMRFYLAGEGDARKNFKAKHIFIIGLLACGAIAYWGQDGYITSVAPPVIYILTQMIGKVKIRKETMSDERYAYNDFYAYGYEPPARSKKMIRAMEGGFLGSALGVTLWFLLGKN